MITQAFLFLIYGFVTAITYPLSILPDVTLNSGFGGAITAAGGYLAALNMIIPIDTLLNVFGIFIGYEIGYLTYKVVMWVIRRLPTQS